MQTRQFIRWAVAAALAASAILLTACSGSSSDKAGGTEERDPVVLVFASFTGDIPPQLQEFAGEVARRSGGTLRIEFEPEWRAGDPDAERGTIEDVKAGKADMAWVGARVFDRLDVTSFQALLAPLLVDSYELEGRVFESGIPTNMLEGVEELGVVGIGVLPGPMRRLLGVSHPFLQPSDFDGQVIGGRTSSPFGRSRLSAPRSRRCPRGALSRVSTQQSSTSARSGATGTRRTQSTWLAT